MEKKIIKVELQENDYTYMRHMDQSFKEPLFSFTTRPRLGKVRCRTGLVYCRESFCEYLRQDIRKVSHNGIITTKLHMLTHRRVPNTKFLERHKKTFLNQTLAAQAMANAIESHYGWPLTKVYAIEPCKDQEDILPSNLFYYITASRRWMKAPAMLSLYTLLFRVASNNGKFRFDTRIKDIKSFYEILADASKKSSYSEMYYVGAHISTWPMVLDNYDKLFGSRSIESLYNPGGGAYFFSEGINRLCDQDSKDHKLNRAFVKIMKKARSHLHK